MRSTSPSSTWPDGGGAYWAICCNTLLSVNGPARGFPTRIRRTASSATAVSAASSTMVLPTSHSPVSARNVCRSRIASASAAAAARCDSNGMISVRDSGAAVVMACASGRRAARHPNGRRGRGRRRGRTGRRGVLPVALQLRELLEELFLPRFGKSAGASRTAGRGSSPHGFRRHRQRQTGRDGPLGNRLRRRHRRGRISRAVVVGHARRGRPDTAAERPAGAEHCQYQRYANCICQARPCSRIPPPHPTIPAIQREPVRATVSPINVAAR